MIKSKPISIKISKYIDKIKLVYFCYVIKAFLDLIIQETLYLDLKLEALVCRREASTDVQARRSSRKARQSYVTTPGCCWFHTRSSEAF